MSNDRSWPKAAIAHNSRGGECRITFQAQRLARAFYAPAAEACGLAILPAPFFSPRHNAEKIYFPSVISDKTFFEPLVVVTIVFIEKYPRKLAFK